MHSASLEHLLMQNKPFVCISSVTGKLQNSTPPDLLKNMKILISEVCFRVFQLFAWWLFHSLPSVQSRPPWMNSGPSENRNFHNMHGGPGGHGGHGGHHNFPPPMPNMGAPPMPPNPNGMPPPWMQPPPPPMGQGPAPPGHPMGECSVAKLLRPKLGLNENDHL